MKRMLIAAHGRLAEGLKSALSLIMGEKEQVTCINAFVTDIPLEQQIDDYFASVGEEDQVLVVTDAFFGSVNQKLMMKKPAGCHIVTGANLPLILELSALLEGDEPVTAERLRGIADQARQQLMVVEEGSLPQAEDDFDF